MVSQERYEWLLTAWRTYLREHSDTKPSVICYPDMEAKRWMQSVGISEDELDEVEFSLYMELS